MGKRKFTRGSPTWLLFEKIMQGRLPEAGDMILGPFPRGKAINLCQGLNGCQVQYQWETGVPDELVHFSAKAKAVPGSPDWVVEISRNHAKQGDRKQAKDNWLGELLESLGGAASGAASGDHTHSPLPMVTGQHSDRPYTTQPADIAQQNAAVEAEVARLMRNAPKKHYNELLEGWEAEIKTKSAEEPREPEAAPTEEEMERAEAAAALRTAQRARHEQLKSMDEKASWLCPHCDMPQGTLKGSYLIQQPDGFHERWCPECIEGLKKAPQEVVR